MRTLVGNFVLVTVAAGIALGYLAIFGAEKFAEKLSQSLGRAAS